MMRRMDVYEATEKRLKIIFDYFDYVYVSFSGGKDSGVLLNLCVDYIRRYAPGRKLGVFHMDYEVQYLSRGLGDVYKRQQPDDRICGKGLCR